MKKLIGFAIILVVGFTVYRFITTFLGEEPAASLENPGIETSTMILTSPSFQNNGTIPQKFTCDGLPASKAGGDINPELQVQNVPGTAKSLALIMDDPDAPAGTWTHWTVWNIDPKITMIKEDSVPTSAKATAGKPLSADEGMTSFGRIGYGGPCPPSGKPHRYFFKLYALTDVLILPSGAPLKQLESEIQKYLITSAELIGLYGR